MESQPEYNMEWQPGCMRGGSLVTSGVDIGAALLSHGDRAHRFGLEPHRAHFRAEAPLEREALARTQRRLL